MPHHHGSRLWELPRVSPCRSAAASATASCARIHARILSRRMFPSGGFPQISALQRARAPTMEQALEGILREAEVPDELTMIMRVQGVTKKAIFVSLDTMAALSRFWSGRRFRLYSPSRTLKTDHGLDGRSYSSRSQTKGRRSAEGPRRTRGHALSRFVRVDRSV